MTPALTPVKYFIRIKELSKHPYWAMDGGWTDWKHQAEEFDSEDDALLFAHQHKLTDAYISMEHE